MNPKQEFYDFIKSLVPDQEVVQENYSDSSVKTSIYVPGKSFMFEVYDFQEDTSKNPNFVRGSNRDRARLCQEKGLRYYGIFEDEIFSKAPLIRSMITWRLGCFKGVYLNARDLEVVEIPANLSKEFFDKFHLDGSVRSSKTFALKYEGRVVMAASTRKNFNSEVEVARLASDYDYAVRGGAGKLISAIKGSIGDTALTSYSNNRLSEGGVYKKLGFEDITQTKQPSYYYVDLATRTRVWRYRCKRINKPEILAQFPTEVAQAEGGVFAKEIFGESRPLYRIEDCGHKKWRLVSLTNPEE